MLIDSGFADLQYAVLKINLCAKICRVFFNAKVYLENVQFEESKEFDYVADEALWIKRSLNRINAN
ncbi:hypothetical protein [Chryseobacterium antibioticum]|uniref:hypothetical protein n=1 Tax=Chryseobacterium antibioticum TaxID=2728847 RepID=UPI00145EA912|nr:hypothetical protein [Chryseobacterium antibioticum]